MLFLACSAQAAPFAVRIGETRIALDAPAGFADTTFTGSPRLQEFAEALTSASNRILLFAVTDADLRRFTVGDPIDARRYMVAVTPRGLEREHISPAEFRTFVDESLRELGQSPAPAADYRKFLDAQPGRQPLLAELRRDPETVSVLQGSRLVSPPVGAFADEPPAKYVLSTTTLVLVRGKALNLGVFCAYEGPADLEWIRTMTEHWTDELLRLNDR
ncbi:MAG TPA: hypothetical protein VFX09_09270 [Burkholderiales bacterium]|nr:hypothetical protein [Burkholderiales bacterium]